MKSTADQSNEEAHVTESEQAEMQAECIVRAIDGYLACFPWPAPTAFNQQSTSPAQTAQKRLRLVMTIAAAIRMSEPRKSDLQR